MPSSAKTSSPPPRAITAEVSRNEHAYAMLKERLTSLVYRPGDFLNIATLVEHLDVGRTPINHALHRLATEGLVQIIPRKGVVVSPLSIDDALDLIDVRLANEVLCVRLAAERITDAQLVELRTVAAAFEAAVSTRDITRLMNDDRLFHECIASIAGNTLLGEILKVLHARSQRFWAISLAAEGHLAEVVAEHAAILAAIAARDGDAAAAAATTHILSFRQSLLRGR